MSVAAFVLLLAARADATGITDLPITQTLVFGKLVMPVATADKCVGTYVVIPMRNGEATKKLFKTKVTRDDGVKDLDLFSVTCAP